MHNTPLIATIVAGLSLAFVLGAIAHRLKMPPLVGYLLAGVLVGPHTPGFVADRNLSPELAEIGVILLMFGVGLHFSLKDLLSVRAIAIPGALVQIAAATLMGVALATLLGWTLAAGLVFGLALSVASTVVLLRALQERRLIESERGRIAVGWLIVEDMAMVLALVLLPALAQFVHGADTALMGHMQSDPIADWLGLGIAGTILLTIIKVAGFVVIMLVVGRRVIPWILHEMAHTGSRELFRLAVLVIALGVAYGAAQLYGVSLALGAFFAGMILSESALSQRAAQESLPLRDAFAVLFFVSVGMLFRPMIVVEDPWPILATLFIILLGKSLAAFLIVRAFKYPLGTALMISASLAQIGEFSFILAELGVKLNLLPEKGRDLILAGAIISMMLNPLLFAIAERLNRRLDKHMAAQGLPQPSEDIEPAVKTQLTGHTVLIGYGRVGSLVGPALDYAHLPYLVIEDNEDTVKTLRAAGTEVIAGNAVMTETLACANIAAAKRLVIAIPEAFEAGQVVEQARAQNKALDIVVRAHSDAEVNHLHSLGADIVIMGEREIARTMIEHLLKKNADDVELAELLPA